MKKSLPRYCSRRGSIVAVSDAVVQFLRHNVVSGASAKAVCTVDVHHVGGVGVPVRVGDTLFVSLASFVQESISETYGAALMVALDAAAFATGSALGLQLKQLALRVLLTRLAHGVANFQTSFAVARQHVIHFARTVADAPRVLRDALVIVAALAA